MTLQYKLQILCYNNAMENLSEKNTHITLNVQGKGYDLFSPVKERNSYRYGPCILHIQDGILHAWFSSLGTEEEIIWITYRASEDGGTTWSPERIVLRPTVDAMDTWAASDPGVIYFNGYYYIGYTSTVMYQTIGRSHNAFVARSKRPDGPFEKWNGEGWGGSPQPFIYYDEADWFYGAGEPTFVVLGDTLYCYYTWASADGDFQMVATANLWDEHWPAHLQFHGVAYEKFPGQDSCDVVYVEEWKCFVALSVCNRFTKESGIYMMRSNDGIHFERGTLVQNGILPYCHNVAMCKGPDGHVSIHDPLFIAYTYGGGDTLEYRGKWAMRLQPVSLEIAKTPDFGMRRPFAKNYVQSIGSTFHPVGFYHTPRQIELYPGEKYKLNLYWVDAYGQTQRVSAKSFWKQELHVRDSRGIVESSGLCITAMKPGRSVLEIQGDQGVCHVSVSVQSTKPAILRVRGDADRKILYLNEYSGGMHKKQIRLWAEYENGTFRELIREVHRVCYQTQNPSVALVSERGILTPIQVGTVSVTVTVDGYGSFVVEVEVCKRWQDGTCI